jgi:precorrin-4 methylase
MTQAQNDRAAAILGRRANGLLAHDEALAELADADCTVAIAAAISERVRLRTDLVQRALEAESDEPISVMCRAAGFKMDAYSALLRMRRRANRGESAPARALTFFSALSRTSAERQLPRLAADLGRRDRGR